MTDDTTMWRQGDPTPPACEPCKSDREEQEYDLALSDPNRCFGQGIKEDPLVVWIDRPEHLKRDWVWAHNNFAKAIAKMLSFTHTWIIKGAHDRCYERDDEGRRLPMRQPDAKWLPPDRFLLRKTDMHITLRLGTDLYGCRLSAKAYVVLDGNGNPEKYMTETARRYMREGGHRQVEFRRWQNYRRRRLPRREINLGPNWGIYANVGPYLDTYRPRKRRIDDAYAPRTDYTAPRAYMENQDNIIKGALTRELHALVRHCHSAYSVYRAFHEELAQMANPPPEALIELHTMREHIATMKREIYREAKGLLV
ncbi:hypothetical protein ANO14919_030900 [Xylariales sp. No.14919]|nr:hypothetical protein ANO14919_030900 [Xylariales sp. No.14919]